MSEYFKDLFEFVNLTNGTLVSASKVDRLDRMSNSVAKHDSSQVKSILKLRRSQSAKKVSFGGDEVIYEYNKAEEVQKQVLLWSQTLPVTTHF
jgi:hypothetical protein